MCKIFAWNDMKDLKKKDEEKKYSVLNKLIKGLLVAEAANNPHGTGLFVVKKNGREYLLKRGVDGLGFIIQEGERIDWMIGRSHLVLGHVRYATKGEQKDGNAHPFVFKIVRNGELCRFAGVHNGMFNYQNLKKIAEKVGLKKPERFEVDSFLFFAIMAKLLREENPFPDVLSEIIPELKAGDNFALIMYWEKKLWFIRNEGRPLRVWDLRKYGMGRVITSTESMFKTGLQLAGIDLKEVPFFEPKAYRLYVLEEGEVKTASDIERPYFPEYYPERYYGYYDDFYGGFWLEDECEKDEEALQEKIFEIEAEIADLKEYMRVMESEFSDDPAYLYELEEAEERIAELQKLRRKLKNALKKLKNRKRKKEVRHAGKLK